MIRMKVISANGMREVIAETQARFEAQSGHKLNITVVETGTIRKRVLGGEAFDVIMVPSDAATTDAAAAKAYLTFVAGPQVAPVIKAKCLSPGSRS